MKTTLRRGLLGLLIGFTLACGGGGGASVDDAAKAGSLAKRIERDPASAEAALAEAGWTEAEFKALLFDIAGDPALSKAYTEAMR